MNKYLRQFLIASRMPAFVRLGYKDLRKKFHARHHDFQIEIKKWLFPDRAPEILSGPFQGMVYLDETIWGSITPRWIGSYERELWEVVDEIKKTPYETVIDVGCAEGYYAAGLARALPEANVYAYDLDPFSREQCERLWKMNDSAGNLHILKWCDYEEYASKHQGRTLCVIDIEGGEMDFLNPDSSAEVKRSDILVEIHRTNQEVDQNAEELKSRFDKSHDITVIESVSNRDPDEFDLPSPLPEEKTLKRSFSEGRPYPQLWLWMKQKDESE